MGEMEEKGKRVMDIVLFCWVRGAVVEDGEGEGRGRVSTETSVEWFGSSLMQREGKNIVGEEDQERDEELWCVIWRVGRVGVAIGVDCDARDVGLGFGLVGVGWDGMGWDGMG
jgi:hypothetical protein